MAVFGCERGELALLFSAPQSAQTGPLVTPMANMRRIAFGLAGTSGEPSQTFMGFNGELGASHVVPELVIVGMTTRRGL